MDDYRLDAGYRNNLSFLYCCHIAAGRPAWLELVPTRIVHTFLVGGAMWVGVGGWFARAGVEAGSARLHCWRCHHEQGKRCKPVPWGLRGRPGRNQPPWLRRCLQSPGERPPYVSEVHLAVGGDVAWLHSWLRTLCEPWGTPIEAAEGGRLRIPLRQTGASGGGTGEADCSKATTPGRRPRGLAGGGLLCKHTSGSAHCPHPPLHATLL